MPRVLVIHRDPTEAAERAARLRGEGFDAAPYLSRGASGFGTIRANPPDAIVIDLTSLPSYGRYMGAELRAQKSLRMIPLVFIEGDPEKAAAVRDLLPDAVFTLWPRTAAAIGRAIRQAPQEPAAPNVPHKPLAQKMNIREGSVIALLNAPEDIDSTLAPLPKGARFQKQTGGSDIIMMFAKSAAVLGRALPDLARAMSKGRSLWVMWPKKGSTMARDLDPARIREMVFPFGLVDYKMCAVDKTWSGMVFGVRRAQKKAAP